MARDSSMAVRDGIIGILLADAAVAAIVADRVYSQTTPAKPTFPFIRYGAPTPVPISGSCLDGAEITVSVDCFAKDVRTSGALSERAEDLAGRLGAAMASALDRQAIPLDTGRARIRWTGSLVRIDGDEAGAFMAVVNLRVRAITS